MNAPKEPKRRNREQTKARILAAAQKAFSQVGYAQAGIRAIAEGADVTFPMLLHYFGSKAGLFEAALIDAMRQGALIGSSKETFGATIMRQISNLDYDIHAPAMITLATADPEARQIVMKVVEEYGVTWLAEWLGPPDARLRAVEISMLAISFVLFTRQIPLIPPGDDEAKMVDWLAETIQQIVNRT